MLPMKDSHVIPRQKRALFSNPEQPLRKPFILFIYFFFTEDAVDSQKTWGGREPSRVLRGAVKEDENFVREGRRLILMENIGNDNL